MIRLVRGRFVLSVLVGHMVTPPFLVGHFNFMKKRLMKDLSTVTQQVQMTSREIAELVEKQHYHVKRDIEKMFQDIQLVDVSKLGCTYKDAQNREQTEYLLDKDLTLTLVSGYNAQMRYRIIKRWQELEAQGRLTLPDFSDPVAAARAWADQYEQRLALEHQAKEDKPKVEFHDAVIGSSDTIDMATTAKVLNAKGYGRNNLFTFLRLKKILSKSNAPYQEYIDRGWFRQVESRFNKPNGEICINIKTVVFQKGVDGIRKLIEKDLSND